jgi:hypothetical protein
MAVAINIHAVSPVSILDGSAPAANAFDGKIIKRAITESNTYLLSNKKFILKPPRIKIGYFMLLLLKTSRRDKNFVIIYYSLPI